MIPTAKSKNFFDDSIGSIHVMRFTGLELHNLIQRCRYSRINGGPMYDFDVRRESGEGYFGTGPIDEEYIEEE